LGRQLGRFAGQFIYFDLPGVQMALADEAGARIRLISDGDLSAGIAAAVAGTGVQR